MKDGKYVVFPFQVAGHDFSINLMTIDYDEDNNVVFTFTSGLILTFCQKTKTYFFEDIDIVEYNDIDVSKTIELVKELNPHLTKDALDIIIEYIKRETVPGYQSTMVTADGEELMFCEL